MQPGRVVQIVGDGARGGSLTWLWSEGSPHPLGVATVDDGRTACDALAAALPLSAATNLTDVRLDGPLASAAGELDVMTALGRALLPPELREQIVDTGRSETLSIRVAPARWASQVPWGLLVVDDDGGRLLDYADVSWIGPVLPRDVGLSTRSDQGDGAVWVIDPKVPWPWSQVLDGPAWAGPTLHQHISKGRLRQLLDGSARLFMLGHCTGVGGETSFVLSDGMLRSNELLRGDWTIPRRVALVACASGLDHHDPEPFGLVTAAMVRGAELVQATLWPLPTDHAFNLAGAGDCLSELARAVDGAQAAADPTRAICDWQRDRLAAWRSDATLGNSPLSWGSVATVTSPVRTVGH